MKLSSFSTSKEGLPTLTPIFNCVPIDTIPEKIKIKRQISIFTFFNHKTSFLFRFFQNLKLLLEKIRIHIILSIFFRKTLSVEFDKKAC